MDFYSLQTATTKEPMMQIDPALFSLVEADSHYLVAVDLPSLPAEAIEVLKVKNDFLVQSRTEGDDRTQTVLRCHPQGKGIKVTYKDGVLWLLLPKTKAMQAPRLAAV